MTKILVVVDGVTIGELFPVDFFNMAAGEALASVDKVRAKHAAAGGPGAYLDERPIYRLMSEHQRQYYIDAAQKSRVVTAARLVRMTVEDEGVVPRGTWEP